MCRYSSLINAGRPEAQRLETRRKLTILFALSVNDLNSHWHLALMCAAMCLQSVHNEEQLEESFFFFFFSPTHSFDGIFTTEARLCSCLHPAGRLSVVNISWLKMWSLLLRAKPKANHALDAALNRTESLSRAHFDVWFIHLQTPSLSQ